MSSCANIVTESRTKKWFASNFGPPRRSSRPNASIPRSDSRQAHPRQVFCPRQNASLGASLAYFDGTGQPGRGGETDAWGRMIWAETGPGVPSPPGNEQAALPCRWRRCRQPWTGLVGNQANELYTKEHIVILRPPRAVRGKVTIGARTSKESRENRGWAAYRNSEIRRKSM